MLLVCGAALLILSGPLRIPYPILLVLGGLLLGFGPGVPEADLAAGARPRRDPAAAPLRLGVFHGAARAATEPEGDLAARGRARRDHDGRCRGRRAQRRRSPVGRGVHPRRRRLADRSDRGDRDRPAARSAAPADRRDRGREPRQRRHSARFLRTAIVAAVAGTFSPWEAGLRLVVTIVGGIAVGLAVGYVIASCGGDSTIRRSR